MIAALLVVFVAINPPAVARGLHGRVDRRIALTAVGGTGILTIVLAVVSDGVLDLLDVSSATFQVAAAIVIGVAGLYWLLGGPPQPSDDELLPNAGDWRGLVVPSLIPVLLTPQLVAASISVGADEGVATVALGALAAFGLAVVGLLWHVGPAALWSARVRFVGLLGIVLAIALAVDGVKSV